MGHIRRISKLYNVYIVIALCCLAVGATASSTIVIASSTTDTTNNLTLSIDSQCSFITKGAASATDGNYQATGANGADATFANGNNTRVFNIFCNQTSGYTVTAYATDLDRDGGNGTITFVDFNDYASAKANNANAAVWSAELVDADSDATFGTAASPNIIKHTDGVSDLNGDIFSVNYMAYIGKTTPAGTYSGEAVYTLTANPAPAVVVTLANGANMQDLTADSCAAIPKYSVSGITYQLVDKRDSHSYLVRKLEDGNCWMVQNLSLYAKTTITADNTDLNGTDAENNTFISNWNNATSVTAGASKWTNDATKYQVYNGTYQANTKNTTVSSNNTPTANTGSYYPFIVATAGYDTSVSTDGQQAGNSSICPRNWKLPTGGSSGQFNTLYTTGYSSNKSNFQSAMNINSAYSGYCTSSNCPGASSYVYLWSSTIYSAAGGYRLAANSSSVNPTSYGNKYSGVSVRCVLTGSTN